MSESVSPATATSSALTAATVAVNAAETSHAQADLDTASALVTALPASDDKTALESRITEEQAGIIVAV
jgi:hypothetical protein